MVSERQWRMRLCRDPYGGKPKPKRELRTILCHELPCDELDVDVMRSSPTRAVTSQLLLSFPFDRGSNELCQQFEALSNERSDRNPLHST